MNHRTRGTGLTLIEVVVVIAIVSMLMGAVGVYALGTWGNAQRSTALLDVKSARQALEVYRVAHGAYPEPSLGFAPLVKARTLQQLPKDPWRRPLTWRLEDGEPVVISLGADGAPGGEGDAADLTSRDEPD